MIDDHHGWTAGKVTVLVRAVDRILGSHSVAETAVPVSSLVIFLVLAALLGLLAATWPARRAGRLDVLAAIASQ
jgi:putative ABC transport system permease protein